MKKCYNSYEFGKSYIQRNVRLIFLYKYCSTLVVLMNILHTEPEKPVAKHTNLPAQSVISFLF